MPADPVKSYITARERLLRIYKRNNLFPVYVNGKFAMVSPDFYVYGFFAHTEEGFTAFQIYRAYLFGIEVAFIEQQPAVGNA